MIFGYFTALTIICSNRQPVVLFQSFLIVNFLRLKQRPKPSFCHIMHTSVKNPITHGPFVQHISHQQSHCGGTHLSDRLPFCPCSFLSLRRSLSSVFCFKAATLITLVCNVSFARKLSLTPGVGEYEKRWFVLMVGCNEGEKTKGRKIIRDRRRGGAVMRNVADAPRLMAQIKLVQPFTSVHSLSIVYPSIRMIFSCGWTSKLHFLV